MLMGLNIGLVSVGCFGSRGQSAGGPKPSVSPLVPVPPSPTGPVLSRAEAAVRDQRTVDPHNQAMNAPIASGEARDP